MTKEEKELLRVEVTLRAGRIPAIHIPTPQVEALLRAYLPHPELVFIPSPEWTPEAVAWARKQWSRKRHYLLHATSDTGTQYRVKDTKNKAALDGQKRSQPL